MILMNDFRAEPAALREAELAAVSRVLESGWYVLGPEVETFERKWASVCGTAHAVGTGNGMDAIEIGLRALGIGAGDEVITTPMTAFATVLAILRAGATPVLADIDAGTALLSLESARRCLTARTKAVLLVHLYGQIRDMDRWVAWTHSTGIALLEDCAQAHRASWDGRAAGAFGAFGAYSFYPTKNLGAIGDGGALVTSDEALAARARVLRNYGQSRRYHHSDLGMNSRLDELQAALLKVRLEWLEEFTAGRRRIAASYRRGISNRRVRLLDGPMSQENHVYHLFVVTTEERDRLADHLAGRQVQSLIHYPVPVHRQLPCEGVRRDPEGLDNAERHADACVSIPCHPKMTDEDVRNVIEAVNAYT